MSNTFYVIPKNSDLQHYGVLGMKWGVRRYQNADGSLTTEGRRRYTKRQGGAAGAIYGSLLGPVGSLAGNIIGRHIAGKKFDETEARKLEAHEKMKNMSDQEIFDEVQRTRLLQQYNEIFSRNNANIGENYVNDAMSIIGSTATLARSGLDIATPASSRKGDNIDKRRKALSKGKAATGLTSKLANKVSNMKTPSSSTKYKGDISNLSTRDLQRQVNRARLEQQYTELFAGPVRSTGENYVKNAIGDISGIAGTVASAVSLAKLFM